jgi:hypothetical protein
MDSKSLEGFEVSGNLLQSIVEGFRNYPSVAMKYMAKHGIVKGTAAVDPTGWYPVGPWIAALESMLTEVGANSMYKIGKSVPENAVFPPHIKDVRSAIESIDAAYRMNHRKRGVMMFDPATGKKLDGIGRYGYEPAADENKVISVCDNPYPCDLDRGLIAAMATRFEATARTEHDNDAPCRKKGGASCTYVIFW